MDCLLRLSGTWHGLLKPKMFVPRCSVHLHSLRFLHLETTTLFPPQQDGASQGGRITYDRVTISIQASRIRTHTCTQWCSLGAKTRTIFSKVSGKSDVRYLTVAIVNAISRDLNHCLSSWESTLGFSSSERILEESQTDTLVVRVMRVFSEAVSN